MLLSIYSGLASANALFSRCLHYLNQQAITALLILAALLGFTSPTAFAASVFINELHYDNAGSDQDEGVELAGNAGTDLTDWVLSFYNGGTGTVYKTVTLAGIIPDQANGFGALAFPVSSIQNGDPDGVSLSDAGGNLIEFLSYEGSFTASNGPADGVTSMDIGIDETASPIGQSLQRIGTGSAPTDFSWQLASSSFGSLNPGQSLTSAVPLPAAGWFLLTGCTLLAGVKRRQTAHNLT